MDSPSPYQALFEASPFPMWVYDAETHQVLDVNPAALTHYGHGRTQFLAQRATELKQRPLSGRLVEAAMSFGARPAVAVSVHDVTIDRASEQTAHRNALHDPLTGLGNRQHLDVKLEALLARGIVDGSTCALLLLDLQGLRTVNAELGREAGDQLLVAVSDRIGAVVGTGGRLFRLGGATFAVLVDAVEDVRSARELADAAVSCVTRPFVISGQTLHVSAHAGVALGDPSSDPEDVIRNADVALQSVKEFRGRRIAVYDVDHRELRGVRFTLESELRLAIATGQLRVLYQPILDLQRGEVSGVEALVRWKHPLRGLLPPDEFIGVAERTGLVADIDSWVLSAACRQVRAWHDEGARDLTVSVNLSGRDLDMGRELVALINSELHSNRTRPEWLEVELTESTALHDQQEVKTLLDEVRELGVRIAIDDFGTGYSMLDRIRDLPVDRIKIDRTFVRRATGIGSTLLKSVIGMARALELSVTAEGVETDEQLEFLREHECDKAQGFLIGRPAPPRLLATEFGPPPAGGLAPIHLQA